ncbi:glucosaminidase domain-containing protein [Aequorivita antarctica]|uniref:Peptidoglycan hydrolase n=1 Tax=Aequorivita antarctica TaxID=153266 RepID=A0A5C6Z185_9FLAO|nr:glucosaminidase domain-containing protein [Aequorivita antarctica]TXD73808.1 LysM peptidoglycan-binding domain-containing protein [Aequorivita antarctica]SRX73479.1 Exo-glucosaminidase LytG [Aequorivita antarctica]
MIGRIVTLLLICIICFSSCKSKKTAVKHRKKHNTERVVKVRQPIEEKNTKAEEPEVVVVPVNIPYSERVANYIKEYSDIAKEEMLQYGIPASITLAQGILESGAGAGELTMKANNHFGIKCHTGWEGDSVYHDDDERGECFRKYKDPKYSYRDHSLFLTQRSRYQDLFKLRKDDYKGWAKGLRKAGYATDPKYPDKLIGIIERYNLEAYDNEVLGKKVNYTKSDDSKISTYTVQPGDTLYNISRRFNLTVETLKEYNGLKNNDLAIGQMLYLHAVKNQ